MRSSGKMWSKILKFHFILFIYLICYFTTFVQRKSKSTYKWQEKAWSEEKCITNTGGLSKVTHYSLEWKWLKLLNFGQCILVRTASLAYFVFHRKGDKFQGLWGMDRDASKSDDEDDKSKEPSFTPGGVLFYVNKDGVPLSSKTLQKMWDHVAKVHPDGEQMVEGIQTSDSLPKVS